MPAILAKDQRGNTIRVHEFQGKRFPYIPFHDLDVSLPNLPTIPCRDDDISILTFPKAGTHWTWEIANMLLTDETGISSRHKGDSMLEVQPTEVINNLPSVRLLNTHVCPDMYPRELVEKKAKIIYVTRNPKDIFVSFYHHVKKIKIYEYSGDWESFFELVLAGEVDYGSWFDYTKQWDRFFREHPDIPVLMLSFEDLKKDMAAGVRKMAKFLSAPCSESKVQAVVEKCGFSNMKKEKLVKEELKAIMGDENPIFRKGIIGDWKTHFTVAQNEIFDEEYKKQMKGYSFDFEQYM